MIRKIGKKGSEKKPRLEKISIDSFNDFLNSRKTGQGNFECIIRGNFRTLRTKYTVRDFFTGGEMYKGIHIVSMVKHYIRKSLKDGVYKMPEFKMGYRPYTVWYDCKNVYENKGKELVSLDFRRCYWTTAYKLGYITEKLYLLGLSKEEYKLICNISIGSLGVKETIERYIDGVPQEKISKICDLNPIRLHIIQEVYKTAISIINGSESRKNGFLWFLTDCFFVTKEVADEYAAEIQKAGYDFKRVDYKKYKVTGEFLTDGKYNTKVQWDYFNNNDKTYNFSKRIDINHLKE